MQAVEPGTAYQLNGCFTVNEPGLTFVSLRIAWHGQPDGYGPSITVEDSPGNPSSIGTEQCLSLTNADAPCAALSARYGIIAKGNPAAVQAGGLSLAVDESASAQPCTTPAPEPSQTPTPGPSPAPPSTTQTPRPEPEAPEDTPDAGQEPKTFGSLVNGGFETVRDDGTPYGWRKYGGEMGTSTAFSAEGERSATLTSATESTKWLYQTVSVNGGAVYRLRARGLKVDGGVRELMLRISWYASEDGSGSQIDTADSEPLEQPSSQFAEMDTGPAQAPSEARSAKVRLLARPQSAAEAVAYFDDVSFGVTSEQPAQTSAAGGSTSSTTTANGGGSAGLTTRHAPSAPAGVLPASTGPTTLANVRPAPERPLSVTESGGRPLWPVLLALGLPAAGIALLAADGLRRSRIDGADEPRL